MRTERLKLPFGSGVGPGAAFMFAPQTQLELALAQFGSKALHAHALFYPINRNIDFDSIPVNSIGLIRSSRWSNLISFSVPPNGVTNRNLSRFQSN